MKFTILFMLLITFGTARSEILRNEYQDLDMGSFRNYWARPVSEFPDNSREFLELSLQQDLFFYSSLVASTALFWVFDEDFIQLSGNLSKKMHPDYEDRKKIMFHVFGLPVRRPDNANTGFYHIGDGITWTLFNLGYYAYAGITQDSRAKAVSVQLTEALFSTLVLNQAIKHLTGRQSPKRSTAKRGKWHFFVSPKKYHENVAGHDAFPSGHLATVSSVFTVLAENYPEKEFIWPLGIGLMIPLGISMMANGVHWMSDYPLAIAMGIGMGKIIARKDRKKEESQKISWRVFPLLSASGASGLGVKIIF